MGGYQPHLSNNLSIIWFGFYFNYFKSSMLQMNVISEQMIRFGYFWVHFFQNCVVSFRQIMNWFHKSNEYRDLYLYFMTHCESSHTASADK